VPNSHFTATANPHYWRKGLPYLSQITFKPIVDPNARVNALQTGSVDMIHTNSPTSILQLRGNKKWSYYDNSGSVLGQPTVNCIMLNTGAPPFNNHKLRVAMAKASNPAQYAKVIDKGINAPMYGLFLPGSPYYTKTAYPSHDPAGAARLVSQVQQETGQPVSFSLATTSNSDALRAVEYLQQQFQQAGMKVSILIKAQSALINDALAGTYQATGWRQFGAVDPDLNYIFWSTTTAMATGLSINMAKNSDPQIEAALQQGRSSIEPSVREQAYKTVNQRLGVDLPYLWTDRAVWAVISTPSVQNWNNPKTPSGAPAFGMIGGQIWPTQIWIS